MCVRHSGAAVRDSIPYKKNIFPNVIPNLGPFLQCSIVSVNVTD